MYHHVPSFLPACDSESWFKLCRCLQERLHFVSMHALCNARTMHHSHLPQPCLDKVQSHSSALCKHTCLHLSICSEPNAWSTNSKLQDIFKSWQSNEAIYYYCKSSQPQTACRSVIVSLPCAIATTIINSFNTLTCFWTLSCCLVSLFHALCSHTCCSEGLSHIQTCQFLQV